jgi:hypothetical protein
MRIQTLSDFRGALRSGPYAWPGGYPRFFLTMDGEALSFDAAKKNRGLIAAALRYRNDPSWRVIAFEINWEDAELTCSHSGARIPSAYAKEE